MLCRNTVIYFNEDVRDALHGRLATSLRPGGRLVVGATERVSEPAAPRPRARVPLRLPEALMDTSEYLPMFLAECRENLQELNLAVVRLEEAPDDRETVDAIFRIAHSLKGMAATMGYEGMATLTHKMEDVFELLRQRGTGLTGEVVDVLLACLDALSGAVDAIEADGAESFDPARARRAPRRPRPRPRRPRRGRARARRPAAPSSRRSATGTPCWRSTPRWRPTRRCRPCAPSRSWPPSPSTATCCAPRRPRTTSTASPAAIIEVLLATDQTADAVAAAVRAVPDVGDARVAEATAEPVAEPAPLAAVERPTHPTRRRADVRSARPRRRPPPRSPPSTGPSASTPRAWTSSCT